jgi:alpha-1,2-mannosyltransferase
MVQNGYYFSQLAITVIGILAILWMARHRVLPNSPMPMWMIGLLIVVVAGFEFITFKVSTPPDRFHDFFFAYYPAGQAMAHHDPAKLYALTERGVSGFVNIPVVAYLFAPFGMLGRQTASILFSLVGLIATVAAWLVLVHITKPGHRERWLLALLFLASGPLMHGFKFGNTSHFILLALAAGLALLRGGRSGAAGVVLGAATIIKPPLLLFGFFFALRRDVRGTVGFAAICVVTAALSLLLFGWTDNLHWFQTSILTYSQGWLGAYNVQSVPGFLLRLHADTGLITWVPRLPTPGEKLVAQTVTGLLFLVAIAACLRSALLVRDPSTQQAAVRRDLQYLLVICLCLVSSPLAWSHYYVWLLIPIGFFFGSQPPFPSSARARAVGWLAIALVTPLVGWPWTIANAGVMTAYRSLVISHILFGGLLWFALIAWWLATSGKHPSTPQSDQVTA